MSKIFNFKGLGALAIAAELALSPLPGICEGDAYAQGLPDKPDHSITEGKNEETEEPFIEEFYTYTIQKGDSLALISTKICDILGIERTEKYWPVLAWLNKTSPLIYEGDELIYPTTPKRLKEIRDELNDSKWTAKYIAKYNVYGTQNRPQGQGEFKFVPGKSTVEELVRSIYGDVSDEFVRLYIKATGLGDYLKPEAAIPDNDILFLLTETSFSRNEVNSYENQDGPTLNWDYLSEELRPETMDYLDQLKEQNEAEKPKGK